MKWSTVVVFFLSITIFATVAPGHATVIVVNSGPLSSAETAGRAEAQVNWNDADTSDDTACTECFAALELQKYLRQMTGRADDFVIVKDTAAPQGDWILIGGPASNALSRQVAPQLNVTGEQLTKLEPEGYCLKSGVIDGRRVWLIAGGGRVGTLYGTYEFLYRLGCRWFAPEDEDIPHLERIPAVDACERPSFLSRGFHAWENRGTPAFLLWMARNRLNYWCIEQSDHPLMRKLGIRMSAGQHDAQARFINPAAPYPYKHPRFHGDENKPRDPYPVSPQYHGDADKDGKLSYFEAHPEWFAWKDGRRIPGIQGEFGTNYCTSNAEATHEFVKNYVQALVDGPYRDADVVRLWNLDNGKWCDCPQCKALGTPTDRYVRLVNALDQEIKKARAAGRIHRPIQIIFLVYLDVLAPPSHALPSDFDFTTCIAEFCPYWRCYVHDFNDPACEVNRKYVNQLDGWALDPARYYHGVIRIGEYYNVSVYKCLPLCLMHTMANDIPYDYKIGARHFDYMHVTVAHWGTKALTNYQMARQLWNVETDCEALWQDYFARRYGQAAKTMQNFYQSLELMLSNATVLKFGLAGQLNQGAKELFPDPHLCYQREPGKKCEGPTLVEIVAHGKRCRALIDEAMAMDLPPPIKQRIAEDEQTFTYAERTIAYFSECVQAFQLIRAGHLDEARKHYAEACHLAELLRGDTTSTKFSSRDGNAANAFDATMATKALDHLAKLLANKG